MWNSTRSSWRPNLAWDTVNAAWRLPGVLLLAAFLVGVTGWLVGHVRTDIAHASRRTRRLSRASRLAEAALQSVAHGAGPAARLDAGRRPGAGAAAHAALPALRWRSSPLTSRGSGRGCRTRRMPRAAGGRHAGLAAALDVPCRGRAGRSGRLVARIPSVLVWVADDPEGDGQPLRSRQPAPAADRRGARGRRCARRGECHGVADRPRRAGAAGRLADDREAELNSAALLADHSKDDCPGHGSPRAWTWRRGWLDGSPACWSVFSWGRWRAPRWRSRWQMSRGRKPPGASRLRKTGKVLTNADLPASAVVAPPGAPGRAAATDAADGRRRPRRGDKAGRRHERGRGGQAGGEGAERLPPRPRPRRQTTKPGGGRAPTASTRRWQRRTRRCGS